MSDLDRRTALAGLLATFALPATELVAGSRAFAQSAAAAGVSEENLARAQQILADNPSIDLHTHLGYWESKGMVAPPFAGITYQGDSATRSVIQAMIDAKCKCAWVVLTSDNAVIDFGVQGNKVRDYQGDEPWTEYRRQLAILKGLFETMPMVLATSPEDIEPIAASGKLAVMLSTEGGHMVENDLDRLDQLHAAGLTKFQPIHYVHSGLGDNQTDASSWGGMSSEGLEAVKRAAELGMVIDLAHAGFEAAEDMIDAVSKPVLLSHTMMKFGDYLTRPRFITPRFAEMVADSGGVIGTWTAGAPYGVNDLSDYFEGVVKLVDTVGIDHVGWATDYITFALPDWFKSYDRFPIICAGLLDSGFSDEDLVKFVGGNGLRVLRAAQAK